MAEVTRLTGPSRSGSVPESLPLSDTWVSLGATTSNRHRYLDLDNYLDVNFSGTVFPGPMDPSVTGRVSSVGIVSGSVNPYSLCGLSIFKGGSVISLSTKHL